MRLKEGITYIHEHITIDLSGAKKDLDCRLDTMRETTKELKELKERGVSNIVDVTNRGMGRNVEYAIKVQEEAGINIIFSTGYYKEPFLPREVYNLSEKELADIMIKEITEGIDGTEVKADIIGEIGTSKDTITTIEEKVFIAASIAHIETGRPIITHTTLGTSGLEQIELLKSHGVDLNKVIIGHVDLSEDIDYILRMIEQGVYVAFDTIGKTNYVPEEKRLEMLREICKRGLSNRVLMSMDITRKSHLKSRGGLGYSYLLDHFIPYINENGITQRDIDNMLRKNAVKFFE
ncbi:phosphotriesterase family protein [Fonticella tunisiensis]|uniref:Phosphotriesterase-related protein n=1 Tax=Fonticella tunisiensis TaxID=1096341 RepID=A0A4R7KQI5_9CLOT|nr:phosphotriesterase-related protein [Fonticella tunisiensis]TDT61325.1 phosphotriesterase-related protein [Fonticella tunisiensis]